MIRMQRNTTTRARLMVLGLVVLAAAPALAVPQLMTEYGDQLPWYGADVNAMGGTGTALYRGGMSNVLNPAFLALETGWRLDAGLALDQHHEDRYVPLFDTFESYVTDAAIASNRTQSFQTGFAAAKRVMEFDDDHGLTVAISLADRFPYAYEFDEELRNPSPFDDPRDAIMEARNRKVTGTLRALSLGVGGEVVERVTVGAAVHYNFGTRSESRTVRDYYLDDGDDSYDFQEEHQMDAVNFTVGARGVINERVEIGLAWESSFDASGDLTASRYGEGAFEPQTAEGTLSYPQRFRGGLTFRPRTDPKTAFTIELEYAPWQDAEGARVDGGPVMSLQDVLDVRIGLEHVFYNGVPLRFGFRHFDAYADRDASASVFTTGVGAPVGGGLLHFSVELSKINSMMDHQFPYPDDYFDNEFYTAPDARVEDMRFRLAAGYTIAW